jgi:transcriptional regulator with XRE-family HTH domain
MQRQIIEYSPETVKALRLMQALNLNQLAELSGIPYQTLYKLEAGQRNPRLKTLQRLGDYFNVVFC